MQRKRQYRQSQPMHQIEERLKASPRSRPVHAAANSGSVVNGDPNKSYVLVNSKEDEDFNYDYYGSIGYTIECKTKEKDCVSIKFGSPAKVGDALMWRGMTLMSCSKERSDEIFQNGPEGNTGQSYQDLIMKRVRQGKHESGGQDFSGLRREENWDELNTMGGQDPEILR